MLLFVLMQQIGDDSYKGSANNHSPTAATIDRVTIDRLGPGQTLAVEAIETCARLLSRDNTVTVRWTPAQLGVEGNEVADLYAKGAAESTLQAVDRAYLRQTSFAHMTRVTAEAKTEGTGRWIASHIQRRRVYRPPKGRKLRKSSIECLFSLVPFLCLLFY